jgi:excisionase family DNA binding protein
MSDLLTTRQVQEMLQVDRTTIYRMVEGGQLPAMRVGKQWRFGRADLERWLRDQTVLAAPGATDAADAARSEATALPAAQPAGQEATVSRAVEQLPMPCTQMIQDAFAEALGVTMIVTDMQGRPATHVSNPCGLYAAVMRDDNAVTRCIQDWQQIAGALTLEPKLAPNDLGLLCARGLIRAGNELKGMVFFGGIAPDVWPPNRDEITAMANRFGLDPAYMAANIEGAHRLDRRARERLLGLVQRIADIFSYMLEDCNARRECS